MNCGNMRIIEPNKDAHRCPINPGNTLDDIRTDGTIYFDDGLKEIKNGKRYFKNCWRAEITIAGQRYRHRGKDRLDCESWLKLVKQGKIKPTDNKADWWRMEQHKDEAARYDEMIVTAAEESNLLYDYHHTNNLEPIFKYVTERLLPHCIYYCCHSLKMGRATSLDAAVTATSIFLTRIAAGKPITNFTLSVKKMLRVRKETGSFSYYDKPPKEVKMMVNKINFSELAEVWKVTKDRRL